MFNTKRWLWVFGILANFLVSPVVVLAENYPARQVKIVVGFSPGGGPDITARLLGQKFFEKWGQNFVVENKPGAGANIASQIVATSKPDGYTLLSVSNAFTISPAIYSKLPFDPLTDFEAITMTATGPALLIVSPNLKVNTVSDLIALAKKQPGRLTYSSAGVGSGSHFGAELLKANAGLEVLHIPMKGIPEALTEVISGRVDFFISPYPSAVAMVRDGRAKTLGITSLKRFKGYPELPTLTESGAPGYQFEFWYGLLAPANTPKDILAQIAAEVKRVNELPDVRERYQSLGIDPVSTTPEQFDKFIKNDIKDLTRVAKQAKISAD